MWKKSIIALLLVEDNPGDARLLREMFNDARLHTTNFAHAGRMSEAEKYLAGHAVDIILLDLGLPDARGLEAVRRARAAAPRVPLVVLTGSDDQSLAARALQEGAQDYLIKGQIENIVLLRTLRYAIERKILEDALFDEKERAQVTLDSIGDAVACTDNAGIITFLNLVGETMTKWSLQEANGKPMANVLRILNAVTREPIPLPLFTELGKERCEHLPPDCILVRRDRCEIPIEGSIAPIHDRLGKAIGAVIVFRDVSAARAMALQITHSAEHDKDKLLDLVITPSTAHGVGAHLAGASTSAA